MGRRRISRRTRIRADSDAGAHRGDRRYVRCDDDESAISKGDGARLRGRKDQELRRNALRSARRRCVRERGRPRRDHDRRTSEGRGLIRSQVAARRSQVALRCAPMFLLATVVVFARETPATRDLRAATSSCDRVVQSILHGNYQRALMQLEGAPSPGRSEAERANLRGLATMLGGDAKKSLDDFNLALELQPSLAEAHLNRGIAYMRLGDFVRASRDFETVWSDPKSSLRARAAYHDALSMDAMKRAADAETWINRALEVDPLFDDAILFSALLR